MIVGDTYVCLSTNSFKISLNPSDKMFCTLWLSVLTHVY